MAKPQLPQDFKEFLKLLNSCGVKYLVIGGYAVGYHGYPRATGDIDIWVEGKSENAEKVVRAVREFGFDVPNLNAALFAAENKVVRMGVPPLRIELLTSVSGLDFASSFCRRIKAVWDEVPIDLICLADLKQNKQAAGRHKDLDDLEKLP